MADREQEAAVKQAGEVDSQLLEALVAEVLSRVQKEPADPGRLLEDALVRPPIEEPRDYSTKIEIDETNTGSLESSFDGSEPSHGTPPLPPRPNTDKPVVLIWEKDKPPEWKPLDCE
jgi:hypothetical protein